MRLRGKQQSHQKTSEQENPKWALPHTAHHPHFILLNNIYINIYIHLYKGQLGPDTLA